MNSISKEEPMMSIIKIPNQSNPANEIKRAIVIGASSGIGRELAILLSKEQYEVGLVARREPLLKDLQAKLHGVSYIQVIDIANMETAKPQWEALLDRMGKVDLIVISAGIGELTTELNWEDDKKTIDTNITGVTQIIHMAIAHFMSHGKGHLVVISSLAALRGGADAISYNASKAYLANYAEGLQGFLYRKQSPILVTDVRPGLVDTPMAKGEGLFWVQSVPKIAKQIWRGIQKRKAVVVVSKRWRIIALLMRLIPRSLWKRM
jgi:short-subunit dehydrogenase